jgi:hypothetical protein
MLGILLGILVSLFSIAATAACIVLSSRRDADIKSGKAKPPDRHKWEE